MKLGLVLGAGGATAWVFHTGVLETLAAEWGVDPADAEVIVGTSAGATVAAAVREGIDTAEIRRAVTTPPTPEQRPCQHEVQGVIRRQQHRFPWRQGVHHALQVGRGRRFRRRLRLPPDDPKCGSARITETRKHANVAMNIPAGLEWPLEQLLNQASSHRRLARSVRTGKCDHHARRGTKDVDKVGQHDMDKRNRPARISPPQRLAKGSSIRL